MGIILLYTKRFAFKCHTVDCIGFLHLLFSFRHQNLCSLATKSLYRYHVFCWKSIVLMFKMKCTLTRICHLAKGYPSNYIKEPIATQLSSYWTEKYLNELHSFNNLYETWPKPTRKSPSEWMLSNTAYYRSSFLMPIFMCLLFCNAFKIYW